MSVRFFGATSPYLAAAAYMLYTRLDKDFARFHFMSTRNHAYIPTQLKAIARLGVPVSLSIMADIGSSMAYNALIGVTGGKEALIATSILNQLNSFMMIIRPPIAQTISLQLSFYAGHHEYDQASNFARKGLLVSTFYTTPIPLISAAVPDILVLISGKKIDSMTFMRQLAPILGVTQIMEGLRMSFTHQMHGINDNNIPALISISGTAAGIITGALTGLYTNGGVFALTGAYASGLTIAVIGLGTRWYFSSKPEQIQKLQQRQAAVYHSSSGFTLFKCCRRGNHETVNLLDDNTAEPSVTALKQ